MNGHVTDHLSDYLDEELDAGDRAAVDAHLQVCALCSEELNSLRRIVAHATTVAEHDTAPTRDLWSGIRARIAQESIDDVAGGRVSRLAGAAARRTTAPHRISFSIAQLAAAAVLLMAVSGATAWFLRGSAPDTFTAASSVIQAEVEPTPSSADARLVNFADAQYDAAISDLERALQERRNDLNPRTVEILVRNLKLIDAAIAQARQALEEDPSNTYLNRHLVESRRRKLELLRRATTITEGD
jgi:anti-sigma factor RsiW